MTSEIISETPINAYQLKEELAKIRKRDKELNFRAQKTEEHILAVATQKHVDGLFEDLNKLAVQRLKENHIHKIIDAMPSSANELKVLLQGYTLSLSAENMKKIIDTVEKYKK